MLKHTVLKFWMLALVASLLVACGDSDGSSSSGGQKADMSKLKAAEGGVYYGGIFKMNETEYFRSLYPLNVGEVVGHRITNQVYEGLLRFNQADLSIMPALAERWEIDSSQTVYTYYLRKGVKFHDDPCFADGKGREMTAQDVKFCFDKWCVQTAQNKGYDFIKDHIKGAQAYSEAVNNGETVAGGVAGVTIVDDYTIQISINEPFSSFNQFLALPFGAVYPQEAFDKYGVEMRAKTVGTGPFYIKTIQENEAVVLLRNSNYWGKDKSGNQLPYLNGIRFTFIADEMSSLREFTQGKHDLKYRLPPEITEEIVDREGNLQGDYKKYTFQTQPTMSVEYYGFLHTGKIFNNKKLRQAFCYAIDREKIVDLVLKGAGIPGKYGFAPPAFKKYQSDKLKGYTYNADKARSLMAEAGYPDGKGFAPLNLNINSGGKRNEQVAEAIQKMLMETLNIELKISKMPFAQHLENTETSKFDFWRAGWIADYPDPENFLNLLWSIHIPDSPEKNSYLNTFRYKNPAYDALMAQALRTVDEQQRMDLYLQADQILIDDAVLIPLFYQKDMRLLQPDVRNFPQNPMEYRNLVDVYFVPEKS